MVMRATIEEELDVILPSIILRMRLEDMLPIILLVVRSGSRRGECLGRLVRLS